MRAPTGILSVRLFDFRNLPDQLTYQYHIALSPTDGHLYISDPEMYQIVRVQLDKHMEAVEGNTADSVVGNGKRCVDPDIDLCGDGTGAMEAKLHYPKGEIQTSLFSPVLYALRESRWGSA